MQRSLYVIALLLMFAGTIFVLSAEAPEERTIISDDGRLRLVGQFFAKRRGVYFHRRSACLSTLPGRQNYDDSGYGHGQL